MDHRALGLALQPRSIWIGPLPPMSLQPATSRAANVGYRLAYRLGGLLESVRDSPDQVHP